MSDTRFRVTRRGSKADEQEIRELLDPTIEIVLPSGNPSWRHQILALAVVEILARLFPRIRIVCDEDALADGHLPPGLALLMARLEEVRTHGVAAEEPEETKLRLIVGASTRAADIYVDGAEWQSYVGAVPSRLIAEESTYLPVGPLVAACRASAQVASRILGDRLPHSFTIDSSYWSALSFRHSSDPLLNEPELPIPDHLDALLVGAGSIGGAACYLLARLAQLTGDLAVTDPDVLSPHNPQRAILATVELAKSAAVKVDVAKAALAHLAIEVEAQQMTVAEFVASCEREANLPLVLSAVDSVSSRREIQDALPLNLIDAACSPDEIGVSGHRTDDGPCIYCLHIGNVLAREAIHLRLLERATGFTERVILAFLHNEVPLSEQHLAEIERYRDIPAGSLSDHLGKTLEQLYRDALLYGEMTVKTSGGGEAAVVAPFVTALAGFLLASEALKFCAGDAYRPYRLGALGELPTIYRESSYASPEFAQSLGADRHEGPECLCRSPRRLALLRERYAL